MGIDAYRHVDRCPGYRVGFATAPIGGHLAHQAQPDAAQAPNGLARCGPKAFVLGPCRHYGLRLKPSTSPRQLFWAGPARWHDEGTMGHFGRASPWPGTRMTVAGGGGGRRRSTELARVGAKKRRPLVEGMVSHPVLKAKPNA
jgi:hypothetical protein